MKKFKFVKPFSSFAMNKERKNATLKENWVHALHDPAYLILCGCLLSLLIIFVILLSSCNKRSCPTYDSRNTNGQYSNVKPEKR